MPCASRLCHQPQPKKILKGLIGIPNKHSIPTITQLRSGHIPLFQYLHSRHLLQNPDCACNAGSETVDHVLFIGSCHTQPRLKLKAAINELEILFNRSILHNPDAFPAVANFVSDSTLGV
ncbi:hypothetical protein CROQUDRAFT_97874 [Cronartium quercuum f. sp. fusiforme G11]|uniref:Uncharacterized protein n=1 Tax=Cronartium quercuum f. sp. fusiforme G11 TaxID=708437 RepID=A0A9P6NEF3_9BASI|nr:hypothetical protein CROQUDRAFT_97874 [Cronartium quercuum f. sp. fusiforme G11]